MKKIKFLGLDMDHTLIRYNTQKFEALVYRLVINRLVQDYGYPQEIRQFKFDFAKAIRGLVVDKKNGNILKLSRYGSIRAAYHGTEKVGFAQMKAMYRSTYIDLGDANYMAVDTSFSISFCVLYSQLVQFKDNGGDSLPDYEQIAKDVAIGIDDVHKDGSLKSVVSQNLDEYVIKEKAVVDGLKRFRLHGKKLFLLTNSEFYYTKLLLDHAINPFLEKGETWQDLFDYTIAFAQKPRFFYDNLKFLKINPEDGSMSNLNGKIEPGVYQGGCAQKFTSDLELNGDEILYLGDHIYGDIVRLKKDCNWRTALVVEELGEEIENYKKALPIEKTIGEFMKKKEPIEEKHVNLCTLRIEENTKKYNDEIQKLQGQISEIDEKIREQLNRQNECYNPYWGRVFRAGAEESYFGYQVNRYACIYMEKLSDLLEYSPRNYFRASRRLLAHEMEING